MSAPHGSPKRFLLAANGDLINVDYVRLLREETATGKIFANMTTGPDIELLVDTTTFKSMRQDLPLNHL